MFLFGNPGGDITSKTKSCAFTYLVFILLAGSIQGIEITPDEVLVDSALSRISATMQGSGANKNYGALWSPVWTYLYEDVELDNRWAKGTCSVGGGSKPAPNQTLDAALGSWADVSYSISETNSNYAGGYLYQGASSTAEARVNFKLDAAPSWLGRITGQKIVYLEITANHQLFTMKTDPNDTSPFAIAGLAIGMNLGSWVSGIALKQTYNRTEDDTEQIVVVANEYGDIGYNHDPDTGKGSMVLSNVPIRIGEEYQMIIWTQASAWVSIVYDPGGPSKEAGSSAMVDPVIKLEPGTPDPEALSLVVSANLYKKPIEEHQLVVKLSQDGKTTNNPDPGKGPVTISAEFQEEMPNTTTKYIWFNDNEFTDTYNSPNDGEYVFEPEDLEPGNYTIGIMAIHPSLGRATKEITLRITTNPEPVTETFTFTGILLLIQLIIKKLIPRKNQLHC